ncbi:MAG: putative endonuclease [Parcubacteria group bacterium Athens0714_26]|nr:MAG: putative endonuclease [Parcubacteria group bacterium Athens0714_26]
MAELADLPAGRQARTTQNNMIYYAYAISLTRKYVYVGLTNNLKRRFSQHQTGKEKTTCPYKPFQLIYWEGFENRKLDREKEKYLKSGSEKEWLKK